MAAAQSSEATTEQTPLQLARREKAPAKPDVLTSIAAFIFSGGQSASSVEKIRAKRHTWLAERRAKNGNANSSEYVDARAAKEREAAEESERAREEERRMAGVGSSAEHSDEVPPPYMNDVPEYREH